MARMRNMMASARSSRPVAWLKKHWLKVVIAIVVIYVIYWLFIQDDMENFSKNELNQFKQLLDDSKDLYDRAKKAEDDVNAGTMTAPNCNNSTNPYQSSTTLGCSDYTDATYIAYELAKGIYDEAKKEYKKSQKKKKKRSLNSRIRRFFGMR